MLRAQIEAFIERLNTTAEGKAGVCAETLDGDERIAIRAGETFPAASTIEIFILDALLARADAGERLEFTADFAKPARARCTTSSRVRDRARAISRG